VSAHPSAADGRTAGGGILATLTEFAAELRQTGISVQLPEIADAAEALRRLPAPEYQLVRSALACTLVKNDSELDAFGLLFGIFFGGRGPDTATGAAGRSLTDLDDGELVAAVERSLGRADDLALRRLADIAVRRFSGFEAGRPAGGKLYLRRTLAALDPEEMVRRQAGCGPDPATIAGQLFRERVRQVADDFSRELEAAVRRMLVADRGAAAVAGTLRPQLPGATEFLNASSAQLRQLDQVIEPLARTLVLRLARHQKRHGPVDMRRTLRHAVSSGGAPLDLQYKRPRPARPELVVLADVSGSVAAFAQFTFRLLAAMHARLSRLRCFAFLDDVADVTSLVPAASSIGVAAGAILTDPRLIWLDGRSDYGHVLTAFNRGYGRTVGPRTTVLILGDARTNYQDPHPEALAALGRHAGHIYWLNPEPARYWDAGDSVMAAYAPFCDQVVECRDVSQLRNFVAGLDV
jgi:uncharacterized protein with von Willebrand factor type A (vWA) domain